MAISKAEKKAARLEARERRRAASGEIMEGRMRTGIGFAGAYLLTQVAPSFAPSLAANQGIVDTLLAVGGGAVALMDDGPMGDYALGAGLVGATQTLDNFGAKIQEWLARP